MKLHADTPSAQALLEALASLDGQKKPTWGKMDAAGMVEHVNRFMQLYLGHVRMGGLPGFLARYIGKPFLKRVAKQSPFETPKNLATAPVLAVKKGSDLAQQVAQYAVLSGQIEALKGKYNHPVYGPMDAEDVKGLVRHHTAHHFHQFGLI